MLATACGSSSVSIGGGSGTCSAACRGLGLISTGFLVSKPCRSSSSFRISILPGSLGLVVARIISCPCSALNSPARQQRCTNINSSICLASSIIVEVDMM
ncbi:hypothetical protein JTE90_018541 [Oedothorax gibbosus]|uniref:Uncharacterized protein n=1 Tax=Oedothorax gibbosus TaxID=931172 RepID=A0AAV6V4L0_9ARAC|nr:hypothetical protein JTE90_018541 [Oedothorax gibbosus]